MDGDTFDNPWLVRDHIALLEKYPPVRESVEWREAERETQRHMSREEHCRLLAGRVKTMTEIFMRRLRTVYEGAKKQSELLETAAKKDNGEEEGGLVPVDVLPPVRRFEEVDDIFDELLPRSPHAAPLISRSSDTEYNTTGEHATEQEADVSAPFARQQSSLRTSNQPNRSKKSVTLPKQPLSFKTNGVSKATPAYESTGDDLGLGHPVESREQELMMLEARLLQEVEALELSHSDRLVVNEQLAHPVLPPNFSKAKTARPSVSKKSRFRLKSKSRDLSASDPKPRQSLHDELGPYVAQPQTPVSNSAELQRKGSHTHSPPNDGSEGAAEERQSLTAEQAKQVKQHAQELHHAEQLAMMQESERTRELMSLKLLPLLVKREVQTLDRDQYLTEEMLRKNGAKTGASTEHAVKEGLRLEVLVDVRKHIQASGETHNFDTIEKQLTSKEEELRELHATVSAQMDVNEGLHEELSRERTFLKCAAEQKKQTIIEEYKTQEIRDSKIRKYCKGVQCCIKATNLEEEARVLAIQKRELLLKQELGNINLVLANVAAFNEVTETELVCRFCLNVIVDAYSIYPCGHSVCHACIEEIRVDETSIMCPDCKYLSTELPVQNHNLSIIANRWTGHGDRDTWSILATMRLAIDSISKVLERWQRPAPT